MIHFAQVKSSESKPTNAELSGLPKRSVLLIDARSQKPDGDITYTSQPYHLLGGRANYHRGFLPMHAVHRAIYVIKIAEFLIYSFSKLKVRNELQWI